MAGASRVPACLFRAGCGIVQPRPAGGDFGRFRLVSPACSSGTVRVAVNMVLRRRSPQRLLVRALAVLVALALGAPGALAAEPAPVAGGEIVVGRSAAGVSLGESRADVLALLGTPFYANRFGYMQYAPDDAPAGFDVYCTGDRKADVVRMIGVLGGDFTISTVHIFRPGGLLRLARRMPGRIRPVRMETGERAYRVNSRLPDGRRAWTDFGTRDPRRGMRSRVLSVFLLLPDVR